MLHDARRTFRAEYAAIDRMCRIAFDIANLSVLDMDVDAASASAHVAGRLFDLVADRLVEFELGFGHAAYCEANVEKTRDNKYCGSQIMWERVHPRLDLSDCGNLNHQSRASQLPQLSNL